MTQSNTFQSGFVNIIGQPNVGKSTLLNALLGEKISIVTPKKQTTRHRIHGILTTNRYQIVFSDTPGILQPKYLLHKRMMGFVQQALEDADVFLYLVEAHEDSEKHGEYMQTLLEKGVPVLLILNKVDLADQEQVEQQIQAYNQWLPAENIIPISATKAFNLQRILMRILDYLPENPPFFPDDQVTDKTERFIVSEIIREKVLYKFKQEIPYSVEVDITEFDEQPEIVNIRAEIIANKKSQKPILIGEKGQALKKVGSEARADIENFLNKQVFLDLYVKVRENWRDKERFLNQFGYNN